MSVVNRCARCEKSVYPTEELKCLDKVWHKICFKCQECGMTLNMKTYKGYNKLPYCNAHTPVAKHTIVTDTPEARRLAENTKIQSQAKYHEEFERTLKGKVTQVVDDPEMTRLKQTAKIISNVEYHREVDKKHDMEMRRRLLSGDDNSRTASDTRQRSRDSSLDRIQDALANIKVSNGAIRSQRITSSSFDGGGYSSDSSSSHHSQQQHRQQQHQQQLQHKPYGGLSDSANTPGAPGKSAAQGPHTVASSSEFYDPYALHANHGVSDSNSNVRYQHPQHLSTHLHASKDNFAQNGLAMTNRPSAALLNSPQHNQPILSQSKPVFPSSSSGQLHNPSSAATPPGLVQHATHPGNVVSYGEPLQYQQHSITASAPFVASNSAEVLSTQVASVQHQGNMLKQYAGVAPSATNNQHLSGDGSEAARHASMLVSTSLSSPHQPQNSFQQTVRTSNTNAAFYPNPSGKGTSAGTYAQSLPFNPTIHIQGQAPKVQQQQQHFSPQAQHDQSQFRHHPAPQLSHVQYAQYPQHQTQAAFSSQQRLTSGGEPSPPEYSASLRGQQSGNLVYAPHTNYQQQQTTLQPRQSNLVSTEPSSVAFGANVVGNCNRLVGSYRAMFDYVAKDTDEVSFADGDLIIDVVRIDKGWMIGRVARTGQRGMLPANYVEQC